MIVSGKRSFSKAFRAGHFFGRGLSDMGTLFGGIFSEKDILVGAF